MTLGTDILKAVAAGGMNSPTWQPKCEANQKEKQRASATRPSLETDLDSLYESIGNDRLSCAQWAKRMGWRPDIVRCRADILMRRKLIKRTTGILPFLYFKAQVSK